MPRNFCNADLSSKFDEWLCGFNMGTDDPSPCSKIFPKQSVESFHRTVREHLLEQFQTLDHSAMLTVKRLIQFGINEKNSKDGTNLRESYEQAARLATGIPQRRFAMIAQREIRHKL